MTGKLVSPEGKEINATETITDLTQNLIETFDQHRLGIIDNATAKARAQIAGTVIASLRTKIVYDELHGKTPEIKFIEDKKEGN